MDQFLRRQLVEFFRSLDSALHEHRTKGTPAGDASYGKIYEQLSGDLATLGVGKDRIPRVAEECGQLSTVERLVKLMAERTTSEPVKEAIRSMDELLRELSQIRESHIPDESLRSAKLETVTARIYERLKAWGFPSEAERASEETLSQE